MEHVVFFPTADGAPAFRRVPTLEEAVRLVEHLRNVEGVADVAVHPLGAELPLAFRAWYRVEVPGAGVAETADTPAAAAPSVPVPLVPAQAEPAALPEPAPARGSDTHGGEGVGSLGFFA